MNYKSVEITLYYLWNLIFGTGQGFGLFLLVTFNFVFIMVLKRVLLGRTLSLRQVTIPSFFLTMYSVILLYPSIVYFIESTSDTRFTAFIAIQIAPVLFIVGVRLANQLWRRPAHQIQLFLNGMTQPVEPGSFERGCFYGFLAMSLAVIVYYLKTATYIPLLGAFSGSTSLTRDSVRFAIYEMPESFLFLYALTIRLLLPFALLYSYSRCKSSGGVWRGIFALVLVGTLFCSLLSFERQNPLSVVMLLAIALYFENGRRFTLFQFSMVLLAGLLGGLVSRAQYSNLIDWSQSGAYAIYFLVMRVWFDPAYTTFAVFEYFGDEPAFLMGRCIKLLTSIGIECPNPKAPITAIGFLSDFWINFGWVGVVFGPVFYGFLFQFVQLSLFDKGTLAKRIILVIFIVNASWAIYGNLASTMIVSVFSLGLCLLLAERWFVKDKRVRNTRIRMQPLGAPSN